MSFGTDEDDPEKILGSKIYRPFSKLHINNTSQ